MAKTPRVPNVSMRVSGCIRGTVDGAVV